MRRRNVALDEVSHGVSERSGFEEVILHLDDAEGGRVQLPHATFEVDGYAREPAGGEHVRRGLDGIRGFYGRLFSNGGGIPLEHWAVTDDGRRCALEYNVVRWGATELPPQAGMAVYERGAGGRLAAARSYDDVEPPLS